MVEAQLAPEETKAKVLSAVSKNLPQQDDSASIEFDRRVKIAELMLKEADLENNSKIVEMQMMKSRLKQEDDNDLEEMLDKS
jgi:hypothetical protein